ncbi:alcohol dehydrogenase superfamily protein [Hymenopellis radicata]|nr:alcohol dehydrogenase superfamily protein [Hymenopellis radicata]
MSLPTTTKEYYFPERGSFTNLRLKESSIPPLKANEVLVKTHAVSLQYRDLMLANATYPTVIQIPDNLVPCSDMAGEILAVGDVVTKWKVGDRVCANFALDHVHGNMSVEIFQTALGGATQGVLTQYRAFPAHSLVAIPEHLSYEEASTLPCAALTAYNALMGPVQLKAGDNVLILGTGGVSIFGLQFAVASGATVIVTSSSDAKLEIAKKLGATHLINYSKTPAWDEELLKLTAGRGANHVLEVGGPGTLEKSLSAVAFNGWVNLIGVLDKSDTALASVFGRTVFKSSNLRGILVGSVTQFQDMLKLMSANPETTRPVIDKVFTFDQALDAYAHLESQAHVGKVVIKVTEN